LLNYTCECLGDSYSGRYCEITSIKVKIYDITAKSLTSAAILVISSAALFIIIMDILRYYFGIDPVDEERKRIRRKKKPVKHKPVIQRFIYIPAPSELRLSK
jgi:hypothetical protein